MQEQAGQSSQAIHLVVSAAAPGLLAAGTALDGLAAGRNGALTWLAFWTLVCGVMLGAWCVLWALVDWIFAEASRPAILVYQGLSTATVVGLFGIVALLRVDSAAHSASTPASALEVGAVAVLGMKAWLGAELTAWLAH
jgi:hypothetical protein